METTNNSTACSIKRLSCTATAVLVLVWSIALPLPAASQTAGEYQVKAAFLLNFAKFIEWPDDSMNGNLVLGIIGDDPFGRNIDQIVGSSLANGHRLFVKRLKWGDSLHGCNILFVSSSERKRLPQILEAVRGSSVLTVGETPQFTQTGGMIRFFIQDNKVRFEINADAAAQAGLRISSKLLALSRR